MPKRPNRLLVALSLAMAASSLAGCGGTSASPSSPNGSAPPGSPGSPIRPAAAPPATRASTPPVALPSVASPSVASPSVALPSAASPSELLPTAAASYLTASNWQRVAGGAAFEGAALNDVVAAGPGFVASGSVGGTSATSPRRAAIWTSSDGRGWSRVPDGPAFADRFPNGAGFPGLGGAIAIAANGPRVVAVGGVGPGFGESMSAAAWTSSDGAHWTRSPAPRSFAGAYALDVAAGNGGFIAVGVRCRGCIVPMGAPLPPDAETAAIWQSNDGATWRPVAAAAFDGAVPEHIVWTGRRYLVLGAPSADLAQCPNCFGSATLLWSSEDGANWSKVGGLPAEFAAEGLLVGPSGVAAQPPTFGSPDGLRWSALGALPAIENGGVTAGLALPNGYLLAGSVVFPADNSHDVPAFFTSTDAVHWSASVVVPPAADLDRANWLAAAAANGATAVVVGWYGTGPDGCPSCFEKGQVFVSPLAAVLP